MKINFVKNNYPRIMKISLSNLQHTFSRTIVLTLLVTVLSFILFVGAIFSLSMKNGLQNLKNRMGADIMIVPTENKVDLEGILLKGKPSCFYFSKSLVDKVAKLDGVEICSSQFFLTSLDAECCDTRVQLIGFDPETDFSIQPWIAEKYNGKLDSGAVIVGSDIDIKAGENLKLFDTEYEVAAKLEATGTGLDQAVYANIDTIKNMYTIAYEKGQRFLDEANPDKFISTILIRIKDNYDMQILVKNIRKALGAVQVIESKSMISNTADNMENIGGFLYLFMVMFFFVVFTTLILVFSLTANGRKKEFAILRTLGATKSILSQIILTEAVVIGLAGGLLGIIFGIIVVFPFNIYIADMLGMPYLLPSIGIILLIVLLDLLVSMIVGALACVYTAIKISNAETYLTMRAGE